VSRRTLVALGEGRSRCSRWDRRSAAVGSRGESPALRDDVGLGADLEVRPENRSVARTVRSLENSMGPRRFMLFVVSCFATVALALASVGLFGVMAYLVSQRARDRDSARARCASGRGLSRGSRTRAAARDDWRRLWHRRGVLDDAAARIVSLRCQGARFTNVTVAPLLLVAIAALACYLPARRAMRVDPISALREE
jgi:putative ABC transport system permease protein